MAFINGFNERLKLIFPNTIDINHKKILEKKKNYEEFEEFQNNKNFRILFIGKISTGKISLLNLIIGNNKNILKLK